MEYTYNLEFTPEDSEVTRKLEKLMTEWKEEISKFRVDDQNDRMSAQIKRLTKKYNVGGLSELFVTDGPFAHYTNQEKKILFIGWQSHGLNGSDHIREIYEQIKEGKIGEVPLNNKRLEALTLRIAYCILNGYPEYDKKKLPKATEISKNLAEENGISFAFMNLSKFSSKAKEGSNTDKNLMEVFLQTYEPFSRNYFTRELEILNPDLIIGLDVVDRYKKYNIATFLPVGNKGYGERGLVKPYTLKTSLGEYPFIDSQNFFTRDTRWYVDCFSPIREAAMDILENTK